jgi:hypothetical protein
VWQAFRLRGRGKIDPSNLPGLWRRYENLPEVSPWASRGASSRPERVAATLGEGWLEKAKDGEGKNGVGHRAESDSARPFCSP